MAAAADTRNCVATGAYCAAMQRGGKARGRPARRCCRGEHAMNAALCAERYPVLDELPAQLRADVLGRTRIVEVGAGGLLFDESHPCRDFPLVLEGRVCVSKRTANGRELTLYRLLPGESCVISSSCLLGGVDYNARGVAEIPSTLGLIPRPLFDELIGQPAFRTFVFQVFSTRFADLMQMIEQVAFLRLDQRLAALLLSRERVLHATHQQLADELGSVREMVSRTLKTSAARQWIVLGRARIEVVATEGLRHAAQAEAGRDLGHRRPGDEGV
jgi:CRP/FNR family transcriptional regulator